MEKKTIAFQIKGMKQDLAISKSSPDYAYEIVNMRLTPVNEGTMFALVNEKGNSRIPLSRDLSDCTYVGHCVINQYLILFVTENVSGTIYDKIYRIDFSQLNSEDEYPVYELFTTHGSNRLGFSPEHPIETVADYETDAIIKVYWTDGQTQPKVINILKEYPRLRGDNNCCNPNDINFTQDIFFPSTILVKKIDAAGGLFSAGTIQYCFTYFSTNGQETNVVDITPLQYVTNSTKGASPEEVVGVAFKLTISGVDENFEYLRLYSIRRTSVNGAPVAKRVADIPIPKSGGVIYYTDSNTSGEEIDPTLLYYLGGEKIIAKTIEAKDSVLFLGNITMDRQLPKNINGTTMSNHKTGNEYDNPFSNGSISFTSNFSDNKDYQTITTSTGGNDYSYVSELNSGANRVTVYKHREHYRFGLQFQHITGRWSDVLWINDAQISTAPRSYSNNTKFPYPKYEFLRSDVISDLVSQGYIRVRPVVVFPSSSDREIVCQGIVCPTVFNLQERYGGTGPYARASWFARPFSYSGTTTSDDAGVEFRHNHRLKTNGQIGCEIQTMDDLSMASLHNRVNNVGFFTTSTSTTPNDNYSDYFFVDQSVVTLHSPESVFDDTMILSDNTDASVYKFRVVGVVPINSSVSDISIFGSAPIGGNTVEFPKTASHTGGIFWSKTSSEIMKLGFYDKKFSLSGSDGWKYAPAFPYWIDFKRKWMSTVQGDDNDMWRYWIFGAIVYPWQKTGQFIPSPSKVGIKDTILSKVDKDYEASVLQQKKYSHLKYSSNSYFISGSPTTIGNLPIIQYTSDQDVYEYFKDPENNSLKYSGNMDGIVVPGTDRNGKYNIRVSANCCTVKQRDMSGDSFDIIYGSGDNGECTLVFHTLQEIVDGNIATISSIQDQDITFEFLQSSDPVRIKYKSTPHIVIPFKSTSSTRQKYILPSLDGNGNIDSSESLYYNMPDIESQRFSTSIPSIGYLWLGELYKDYDTTSAFGGKTEEAFQANDWVVGGEAVSLTNSTTPASSFTLRWTVGDTYYQRYDCLKTYPFTLEDENSIVEVVSFMCETRVNIDGRYDKNRGRASLVAHPTNFNLLNTAYTQKDNFFTYRGVNMLDNQTSRFPNMLTWTLSKAPAALTDNWTSVNLVSTLNLDGDRGEINRLEKYRNELYSFQDRGIARILYNDRTVLATQNGLPVEIANSGRVEGKMYFTESEGLTNHKSIKVTPEGIYFVDGKTMSAYIFNGQQCLSLSDTKGMKSFFDKKEDSFDIFYDANEKDVYFTDADCCLNFSEKLGEFAGLFSYEGIPLMDNVKDKFISFNNETLWEHYIGDYNSFYGVIKPFSVTFLGTDNIPTDKIFSNLDWAADSFINDSYAPKKTFDRLKVWNEYQTSEISLVDTLGHPSNLKKKFRIWRAQVPRANWNGRDRIRNPWCKVQLRMDNPGRYKTILHNAFLDYFG